MAGPAPFNYDPTQYDYAALDPAPEDEDYADFKRFQKWKKEKAKAAEALPKLEAAKLDVKPDVADRRTGMRVATLEGMKEPQQRNMSESADISQARAQTYLKQATEAQDPELFKKYLDELDKALDYQTAAISEARDATVRDFKAGKIDAKSMNERSDMLVGKDGKGGAIAAIEADRQRIAEARASFLKDQALGAAPESWFDPLHPVRTGLAAVGKGAEWSPVKAALNLLSGAEENVAGYASLAAGAISNEQFAQSGTKVGFGDVVRSASPLTWFDENMPLRQRGREFNEKVGRSLSIGEGMAKDTPVLGNFVDFAQGGLPGLFGGGTFSPGNNALDLVAKDTGLGRDKLNEMKWEAAFAASIDPLNLTDFGGESVLKSMGEAGAVLAKTRAGRKMAALFPDAVRKLPKKTVLWFQGDGVRAGVLGTPFEDVYAAQKLSEKGITYELLAYQDQLAEDAARMLNAAGSEEKLAELEGLAPLLTERRGMLEEAKAGNFVITDPRIAKLSEGDRALLFQLADNLSGHFDEVQRLENAQWLLDTPDLTGRFDYHGREFTDEVQQLIAEHPTASSVIEAEKARFNSDAVLAWERERKLKEFDHFEAAKKVREALRRDGVVIGDDVPIWRTDAYQQLSQRAERSAREAMNRTFWGNVCDVVGESPAAAASLRSRMVTDYAKLDAGAARTSATEGDTIRINALRKAIGEREALLAKPADYAEIPVFHGTARPFAEFDPNAKRVAILDKAGRGQVRGTFFSPHEHVAENYVEFSIPRIIAEAKKAGAAPGVWTHKTIVSSFAKSGAKTEQGTAKWASNTAHQMFAEAEKRSPLGWVSEQLAGEAQRPGVTLVSDIKIMGGRVHSFENSGAGRKALEEMLQHVVSGKYRSSDDLFHIITRTPKFDARVIKTTLRGRMVDLTDARAWPEDLVRALRKSSHSEDVRIAKIFDKALKNDGEFQSLNTIERSPALQKWLKEKGYDIVKKPENDQITGSFSYWSPHGTAEKPPVPDKRLGLLQDELKKTEASRAYKLEQLRRLPRSTDPVKFVETYAKGHLNPIRGKATVLELMKSKKVKLPDDINTLARLATTYVDPKDAKRMVRLAEDMGRIGAYTPTRFMQVYDAVKAIAQRAVLGRLSSMTKDNIGTAANLMMAGGTEDLPRALKELGGLGDWMRGTGHSDLVRRLRAAGYLQTTKGEALTQGTLDRIALDLKAEGKKGWAAAARAGARVEKKGVLGAVLPTRKGKLLGGETVTAATDTINAERVYMEELGRVATYLNGIKRGMTHEEAIENGFAAWGKFDEMTKFERKYLNRIFFFRAWWQRSIPITLRHIVDHPVRSKMLLTLMAGDTYDDDKMPRWLRRMGGVTLGKGGDGTVRVLGLGGSSYFSPTFSLLQGDMMRALYKGNVGEAVSGLGSDVIRSSPPFVQSIGEIAQSRDYFRNEDWFKDMQTKTGSNVRAPAFLYHFKDTALGELLNLKEDERGGTVTMNPYYAWAFGLVPGAEPLTGDISAFTDKRQADLGPLSLKKGLVRQAGLPIYNVPELSDRQAAIADMRKQMRKTADTLTGHAIGITDYGDAYVTDRTERGKKIREDMLKWTREAEKLGYPENSDRGRKYVDDKLRDNYLPEWRLVELSRYLNRWARALRDGQDDPALKYTPLKIGAAQDRIEKQGRSEKIRELKTR